MVSAPVISFNTSFVEISSCPEGFPVIACQLNMTIGVVADQMSLLLHTQNQLWIFFAFSPVTKKPAFAPRSARPSKSIFV